MIILVPMIKHVLKRFTSFLRHNAVTVVSVIIAVAVALFIARGGVPAVVKSVIAVMQESSRIRESDLKKLDEQYKREVDAVTTAGNNAVESVIEADKKHEEATKKIEADKSKIVSDLVEGGPEEVTKRLADLADAKNRDT